MRSFLLVILASCTPVEIDMICSTPGESPPPVEPECPTIDVADYIHGIVNEASTAAPCFDLVNSGDVGQVVDFFTLDVNSLTTCDAEGICSTPYSCDQVTTSLAINDLDSGAVIPVAAGSGLNGCAFREMPFQPGRRLEVWHFAEDEITARIGYRVLFFVR